MGEIEVEENRIRYLDGCKGAAASIVFLSHLVLAFAPVFHSMNNADLIKEQTVVRFVASTPLNIFYSGHFAINLFFIITGYVLSYKFLVNKNLEVLTSGAFRRYFRLMFPALFSCIFAYLLLKFHFFYNIEIAPLTGSWFLNIPYHFDANFIKMLKFALYDEFFQFDLKTGYNNVLWIMHFELLGSLLCFSFLALFGRYPKRGLLYFVLLIILYKTYYVAFILGMFLCELNLKRYNCIEYVGQNYFVLITLFLLGIYLASIKSTDLSIYKFLDIKLFKRNLDSFEISFYNIIGGFILLFVIHRSKFLKYIFSKPILTFLGKISFAIYLLHLLVICSLSSFMFKFFIINGYLYKISVLLTSTITLIFTIICSYFFYNTIEKTTNRWINLLYLAFKNNKTAQKYDSTIVYT